MAKCRNELLRLRGLVRERSGSVLLETLRNGGKLAADWNRMLW